MKGFLRNLCLFIHYCRKYPNVAKAYIKTVLLHNRKNEKKAAVVGNLVELGKQLDSYHKLQDELDAKFPGVEMIFDEQE